VSKLHGEVSRSLWKDVWAGVPGHEVPITSITNGVHTKTWMAPEFSALYQKYLGDWEEHLTEPDFWRRVSDIPDAQLWETHQKLKLRLVEFVRERVRTARERAGESPESIRSVNRILDPEILTIGFARRFATYKRANLILRDIDAIAALVNNPKMPVQFVFAGKSHPHDIPGKMMLQEIARLMHDPRFAGKVLFLENYDISIGRRLVQGIDVWINCPRRPLEACGTSGQKVVLNGGLNLSVLDGWWAEAYDGLNGFAIGMGETHTSTERHDARDAESMLRVLGDQVVPLYYDRDRDGLPREWIARMKRAIRTLGWRFSADRMVMDYVLKSYIPAAGGTSSEVGGPG
jgi:starch phosphorylase